MATGAFFSYAIKPLCNKVDEFHGTAATSTWTSVIVGELCGRAVYVLAITGEMVTLPFDEVLAVIVGIGAFFSVLVLRQDFLFNTFDTLTKKIESRSMIFMVLLISSLSFRSIFSSITSCEFSTIKSSDSFSSFYDLNMLIKENQVELNKKTRNDSCWDGEEAFKTTRWDVAKKAFWCPFYRFSEFAFGILYTSINLCTVGLIRKNAKSQQDRTIHSSTLISAPLSVPLDFLSYAIQWTKPKKGIGYDSLIGDEINSVLNSTS